MKAFTTILPVLLMELDHVRQTLEAHGLLLEYKQGGGPHDPTKTDWEPRPEEGFAFSMRWTWSRQRTAVEVQVWLDPGFMDEKDRVVPAKGGLAVSLIAESATALFEFGPESIWSFADTGGKLVSKEEADLFESLMSFTRGASAQQADKHGETCFDRSTALAGIGMICAFFAKLPVD